MPTRRAGRWGGGTRGREMGGPGRPSAPAGPARARRDGPPSAPSPPRRRPPAPTVCAAPAPVYVQHVCGPASGGGTRRVGRGRHRRVRCGRVLGSATRGGQRPRRASLPSSRWWCGGCGGDRRPHRARRARGPPSPPPSFPARRAPAVCPNGVDGRARTAFPPPPGGVRRPPARAADARMLHGAAAKGGAAGGGATTAGARRCQEVQYCACGEVPRLTAAR